MEQTTTQTALHNWFVSEPRAFMNRQEFYGKWGYQSQIAELKTDFVTQLEWLPNRCMMVKIESHFLGELDASQIRQAIEEMLELLQKQYGGVWRLERGTSEHHQVLIRQRQTKLQLRLTVERFHWLLHNSAWHWIGFGRLWYLPYSTYWFLERLAYCLQRTPIPAHINPVVGLSGGGNQIAQRFVFTFILQCTKQLEDNEAIEYVKKLQKSLGKGWVFTRLELKTETQTRDIPISK